MFSIIPEYKILLVPVIKGYYVTKNYILIDFENVQEHDYASIINQNIYLKIFLGEHQKHCPTTMVTQLQKFGEHVEWIQRTGNGHNALDFHIAFVLGELFSAEPSSHYFIVSKDKGFDSLIAYILSKHKQCRRVENIAELKALINETVSKVKIIDANYVITWLKKAPKSRPSTLKSLQSGISSLGKPAKLKPDIVAKIIDVLKVKSIITINDTKISYHC